MLQCLQKFECSNITDYNISGSELTMLRLTDQSRRAPVRWLIVASASNCYAISCEDCTCSSTECTAVVTTDNKDQKDFNQTKNNIITSLSTTPQFRFLHRKQQFNWKLIVSKYDINLFCYQHVFMMINISTIIYDKLINGKYLIRITSVDIFNVNVGVYYHFYLSETWTLQYILYTQVYTYQKFK